MNSSIALKAENVNKIYRQGNENINALNNVSFEVKTGEIFGLLGLMVRANLRLLIF